jgi:hypothetical protein
MRAALRTPKTFVVFTDGVPVPYRENIYFFVKNVLLLKLGGLWMHFYGIWSHFDAFRGG